MNIERLYTPRDIQYGKVKKGTGIPRKGTASRRVIWRYVKDGREFLFHATKGWRSRRV